ncbi:VWA domain-containing protein [Actinomycetota bacterium]
MNTTALARAALAAALGATLGFATATTPPASADEPVEPGRLLLMLDASGSMKDKDPSGLTKIEAAKKALTSVVDGLPAQAQVGLRVYGATQPGGKPTPAACKDTQLVHPIGPLDKTGLNTAIGAFQAKGETPIAYSLTPALNDLGPDGKRNIVLVSDGEESCVPDPCPEIKRLIQQGVDIQIDTVGFAVDTKARTQLQCIADAGNGSYYDAKDATELGLSLGKLSQRALRPFTLAGTRVRGTADAGSAPTLRAGLYQDVSTLADPPRNYRIARRPGSAMRLGITARLLATWQDSDVQRFWVTISTPAGTQCRRETFYRLEQLNRANTVLTASYRVDGVPPGETAQLYRECREAPELIATIDRDEGVSGPVPYEIQVVDEPMVDEGSPLPSASPVPVPDPAPVTGTPVPVIGGGGFSDATALTPGTYSETLLIGEQVFYKVRLAWGQRAVFTVDAPAPGARMEPAPGATVLVNSYTPDRGDTTNGSGKFAQQPWFGRAFKPVLGQYTAYIRHRNLLMSNDEGGMSLVSVPHYSLPGDYHFAVAASPADETQTGAIPLRLRVAVEGTPVATRFAGGQQVLGRGATSGPVDDAGTATPGTTQPGAPTAGPTGTGAQRATASATTAASGSADTEGGTSPLVWAGAGLAGLAVVGGAAYALGRRGRET